MASFFTESNRLDAVFGGDFAARPVRQEFEMTVPLNPEVSFGDILDLVKEPYRASTALWLDRDCVIVDSGRWGSRRPCRYRIGVEPMSGPTRYFYLYQVPGTAERGSPLPALEYLLTRVTNDERLEYFWIVPSCREPNPHEPTTRRTLDVSPDCFSRLLQTSRLHNNRFCSVTLYRLSLTAEQTDLLFTHATSPIFMDLRYCSFHGPTLLRQLETAALRQEQNHALGQGSYLEFKLGCEEYGKSEFTALLSNQHLRTFRLCPTTSDDIMPYEIIKVFVDALAANKIIRLESLHFDAYHSKIEWEKDEEPSAWIALWKAIQQHPSLKEVHLAEHPGLCPLSWWHPVAAAVKVNPRLVLVDVDVSENDEEEDNTPDWKTKFDEHVEPLLERNRYRPKIAALCCTDPSTAAVLLGQAIVAVAGNEDMHSRCKREIIRMLLDQLILTGHDFGGDGHNNGGGDGRLSGKKRALADTAVVVPSDADATKTEARVADGINK